MPIKFGEEIERNWNIFRSTSLKDVDLLLEALQDQFGVKIIKHHSWTVADDKTFVLVFCIL